MSHAVARRLRLRTCHNVRKQLAETDYLERDPQAANVREGREAAMRLINTFLKAWRHEPDVGRWDEQYRQVLPRCSFQGSGWAKKTTDKTMFASNLSPPCREYLELNCAAGMEGDMRSYRLCRHALVGCDKIVAKQVVGQRKLLQASATTVALGATPTNCHW